MIPIHRSTPRSHVSPRPARLPRSLAALALVIPLACGGGQDAPADGAAGDAESPPALDQAATQALSQLPPSIKGEAGPLRGTDLQYVDGDTATTGYLAVPDGEGPFPALVIIHEWNGLQPRVRELADDLAAEGYVTLAADLFKGRTGTNRDENMALVTEVNQNPAEMVANLDAAVAYLRGRDDVTGRVGAMGWCFGGGIALSYGLDGERHEATAIFYGSLLDDPERLGALDHEVYGTFAEMDGGPSPEDVAAFAAALEAAGVANDLHIYDDVNHGFWLRVDQDPGLRAAPAADAWQRLKSYLGRTLGG
ncbi:MAG: dienelactone hydrolase family protein [Gemmatimonadota bacterium]|nr:dienelactone hydrolase family protein [Gemmatimonadota bacterium]